MVAEKIKNLSDMQGITSIMYNMEKVPQNYT